MSTILVNTLTGKTTAGDVTVTDGSVTMKLQKGLLKAFSFITDSDASTIVVATNSLNMSSTTDIATGRYRFTVSNAFADTDYFSAGEPAGQTAYYTMDAMPDLLGTKSTLIFDLRCRTADNSDNDPENVGQSFIGDLA